MRNLALPGYLTFPKAVRLWASITHPGDAMSTPLFERLAAALVQEVQEGRLLAYLNIGTRAVEAHFPVDGRDFGKIQNGEPVDLAPPYVSIPARGVVVFHATDVSEAARIARIFPAVRVPIAEAIVWIATGDPETVATFRARTGEGVEGDNSPELNSQGELVRAIEAGHIAIFGRPLVGECLRPVRPIQAQLWRGADGLRLCAGSPASWLSDTFYATSNPPGPSVFYDLEVCRTALLRAFPAGDDQAQAQARAPNANPPPKQDQNPAEQSTLPEETDAYASASAWYKAVGRDEARKELLDEGKTPTQATMAKRAAEKRNTDRPKDKPVLPKSLERSLRKRS